MRSLPFFIHTKPQAGAARIGAWQADCAADVYQPIVRRLPDVPVAPGPPASPAALAALCGAAAASPTPAEAGTNTAFCSAQLSVTENTGAKAMSKLGSSTWYNYQPVPVYAAVGGVMNRNFLDGPGVGPTEVFCFYWPSYAAVAGRTGGGTNKWAKNVINTVTTSSAATNTPAVAAGFLDYAALTALDPPGGDLFPFFTTAMDRLLRPTFQDTVTVNYFKSYLPAGSL